MGIDLSHKIINQTQKDHIEYIRIVGQKLLEQIEVSCPNSREKSLAITKLEECCMWANKSISHTKEGE